MPSDEARREASLHNHCVPECICWPKCERCQSLATLLDRMMAQARADITQIVVDEITSSTGPTGGWLDSPKAIAAAILERLAGRGK